MGVKHRAFIAQSLIAAGRNADEPIAFVERGGTPQQTVVIACLRDVASGEVAVQNPAVFVIGQAVKLRETLLRSAGGSFAGLIFTSERYFEPSEKSMAASLTRSPIFGWLGSIAGFRP